MGYNGSDKHKLKLWELFSKKQDKLVAGDNITLTPQQDGTVEISADGGGSGTVTDVLVDDVSVVNQDGEAEITMPSDFVGATSQQTGTHGLVPAPLVTEKDKFLKGDGTWDEAGGDKFAPIIYSLEEREVGVWTDGKPLYQKSYYLANANNTTYTLEQTFNAVIQTQVGSWTDSGGYRRPIPYLETNLGVFIYTYNGKLLLQFSPYNATEVFVTIQYTKITDVPGSGTWGTDGVPMVHYDGTERIIGTWFGETLYQKTVDCGGLLFAQTKSVAHGISNLKFVTSYSGTCSGYTPTVYYPLPLVQGSASLTNYQVKIEADDTYIKLTSGADLTPITSSFVTIQYTKTTD